MSFSSGTISGSATPAAALMSALHTAINAHAGWTYIEEVTSGTITTRIYRCNAATNTHGIDFYVGIKRASDASLAVIPVVFESWTTGGTGTVAFPVTTTALAGGTLTPDASGRYNGATASGTALTNCLLGNLVVNTTSFYWNCSITNDRIIFGYLSGGSSGGVYAGAYERLYSSAIDPSPVCLIQPLSEKVNIGSTAIAMFTRELAPFSSLANNWKGYMQQATYVLGPHNPATSTDLTTGFYSAAKCLVGGATSATRASARGRLYDILDCTPGTPGVTGDTATIGGVAYTCVAPNFWSRDGA
jgi:hypothetical protein